MEFPKDEVKNKIVWTKGADFTDGSPRYTFEGRDPATTYERFQVVIYTERERRYAGTGDADVTAPFAPVSRCVRLWGREWHLCTADRHRRCLPPLSPRLWGTVPGTCLFDKSTR